MIVKFLNKLVTYNFISKTKGGGVNLSYPTYIIGHRYIKYDSFNAGPNLRIECIDKYHSQIFTPTLIIGKGVRFNTNCHVGCINKIIIGNNVLIGSNVLITDHSHGYNNETDIILSPEMRDLYSKGPVIINDNVWIGENVCVLPNVVIGSNSIIGCNSVITKDVPPYSVVCGSPARIIKDIKHE